MWKVSRSTRSISAGGTPSLLKEPALHSIMEAVHANFSINPNAEITFEANPDDISADNLQMWKRNGVNRLSIGVQSFFEEDLVWMNRAHSAQQADTSIRLAQDAGISNMSIDLIYGTPGLTDIKWEDNMQRAAALGVPHLSCYALTVEPGTALDIMTRKEKALPVNTDDQARQFLMMTDFFQGKGYEHYEISNLSLPGKRSTHNSSYWNGATYIGLGPSAHSFNGASRQWNVSNNALYIQSLNNHSIPSEIEILTKDQQFNEYVMTALRKMEGIDVAFVKNKFGAEYADELNLSSGKFLGKDWITNSSDRIMLTREGKLFADHVASEMFV